MSWRAAHPVADMVVRRLLTGVVTLWLVSLLVYFATTILPGNAATSALGIQATPERVRALEHELRLDQPMLSRYISWLGAVVRGDPGLSLASGQSVESIVLPALGHSMTLVIIAGVLSSLLGTALGVLAAAKRDSAWDHSMSVGALLLVALPEFVVGIILIILFSTVVWPVLPGVSFLPQGASSLADPALLVLPVATLVIVTVPYLFRIVRGTMIEALQSEYVEMAVLKGVRPVRVLLMHALPTVLAPVVQVLALNLLYLAGGIVVVEYVFNYPGLGQLLVQSVTARDITTIQWIVLLLAGFYILINILADAVALAVTPRRRLPRRA